MLWEDTIGFLFGIAVAGIVCGFVARRFIQRRVTSLKAELDVEAKARELELREQSARRALELDKRIAENERALADQKAQLKLSGSEAVIERERLADERRSLESRRQDLERREEALLDAEHEAEKLRRLYRMKLHQLSHLSEQQARQQLMDAAQRDCEKEIAQLRERKLKRTESEVSDEARRILLASMQRITSQPMNDATATLVPLASEDFKGRIIGREGRNIRTFEHATGTTLMIDETPDSVLISCFDPVRREVARIALEALLRDGRIHPASIEEQVLAAEEEIKSSVIELGENALRSLRLYDIHPEVVTLLGRLHYRLSNNQNTLAHSIEVANLCSLIAAEIGIDTHLAKRAGLLHDIGKAISEEYEGSHASAGARVLKRVGEDPRVVNAVAAHHREVEPESLYAGLVMVADALSAMRPGARTSSIDGFIQRVRNIEEIARTEVGVLDAYAIQAGRELRVLVEPGEISDDAARQMARRLRSRIEDELEYPGTIQITVIREQRYTETAV